MGKVRIGFVGVGSMGQCAHLKNYAVLPDCEVEAIAEIRPMLAKRVAEKYGVPRVYRDHREMLEKEELDGIVAAQPFTRHGVLVPEIMRAGVPVFIEKPLAGSVEVGERIVQAVDRSGTWLMVGYHKRSDPATMYIKAEIDRMKQTRELGEMRYVRITMPPGDWIANGFADRVVTDEPVQELERDPPAPDMDEQTYKEYLDFVNYYIHQVNLLRHLLGEPYSVKYVDGSRILIVAQSDGGVTGIIEAAPYFTTVDWQESAITCFRHGWMKLELPAPLTQNRPGKVEVFKDPGGQVTSQTCVPQLPWIGAMRQQAMNFVRAIGGEIRPPCEAREALEDLKIARDYIRLVKGF